MEREMTIQYKFLFGKVYTFTGTWSKFVDTILMPNSGRITIIKKS